MAAHFLKLKTMTAIIQLGERPNVPSLLRVICAAEEFKSTGLRRWGWSNTAGLHAGHHLTPVCWLRHCDAVLY